MRPEAVANPNVRPEQDEPSGPVGGLLGAAASEAALATPSSAPTGADARVLEQMGVESEGIESGQLLGLVAAVVFAIVALGVVLVYLFYIPYRQQVGDTASDVGDYPELEQSRTEARAKLGQYARVDSVYTLPIERAMALTAARYGAGDSTAAGALPTTSQQFNTLMTNRGAGRAVQQTAGRFVAARLPNNSPGGVRLAPEAPPVPGRTNEEVGVDDNRRDVPPTTLGDVQSE
ncbi:MAG TPA: hypothetical protein VF576_09305 [Rubricoccaceae bacterium]